MRNAMIATMLSCPCDASAAAEMSAVSPGRTASRRLEEHDPEEEREPVVREEMRHDRPRLSRSRCGRSRRAQPRARIGSRAMRVGVTCETTPGERRVALVPETVGKLAAAGFDVVVEPGAGAPASFPDDEYAAAGATLGDPWAADAVVKVRKPSAEEVARLRAGQVLIGFLEPLADPAGSRGSRARGVTAFAIESVPRITRAQAMDALSSQATVGGYKAALLAAEHLPRFFPMLMTAAGTVPPAKVLVIGAGVAGLQAIATARRLGAVDDRLRRAPRRARADREPRRELARPRRHRRGGRGRLRARADARGDGGAAGGARGADRRLRRRDHDRRGARAARRRGSFRRAPSRRCGRARSSSTSPPRAAATAS